MSRIETPINYLDSGERFCMEQFEDERQAGRHATSENNTIKRVSRRPATSSATVPLESGNADESERIPKAAAPEFSPEQRPSSASFSAEAL